MRAISSWSGLSRQRAARRRRKHILDTRIENTFHETLNPLKNLKTAKSGDFRPLGYQRLIKYEISLAKGFRFAFVS